MERISVKAYAKVNLSIEVLSKRKDGYHNIISVMQSVSLFDDITMEKSDKTSFWCDDECLNTSDNLVMRAYKALNQRYNIGPAKITLIKNIPYQSGMGGGSADCAAVLMGLNRLYQLNIPIHELLEIGKNLGADVPACILGGCVIAEGIGEILTPINAKKPIHLVIIKPDISFSTAEMYGKIDKQSAQNRSIGELVEGIKEGNEKKIANNLYNHFESVAKPKEDIEKAKSDLIKSGALNAVMTGAGSAVFGVFADEDLAKEGYRRLKSKGKQAFLCHTLTTGNDMV